MIKMLFQSLWRMLRTCPEENFVFRRKTEPFPVISFCNNRGNIAMLKESQNIRFRTVSQRSDSEETLSVSSGSRHVYLTDKET